MDRKSIIAVVVCFVLLLLWSTVIVPKLYPPKPVPPGQTNSVAAAAPVTATNAGAAAPAPATTSAAAGQLTVSTNPPEQLLVVTNNNARYTFTSYGGGLKRVDLVRYPETTGEPGAKQPTNSFATLNAFTPAPTLAVLDGAAVQGDGIFKLTRTATGVRAEKTLADGLTILKTFTLESNYLVAATVTLQNNSSNDLPLPQQEWVVGTSTPMNPQDVGFGQGSMWWNGKKADEVTPAWFANRTLGCIPGTPRTEYRSGPADVVWAGVHNQYFALVLMPAQPASGLVVRQFNLQPPSAREIAEIPRINRAPEGFEAALIYPALNLAPHQSLQRRFVVFAGPKEYRTLARIAAQFHNHVDVVMNFGWTGFISKGLLLAMNALHSALGFSYGWAIVAITVIIKIIFWPLTRASIRSMKRMQELAPQMKALQEKYKDDPQKLSQKQWEFWKQNKVNPMGGCLPMVVQMPVLFAFYFMIRSAIELRGASWLWVPDLSKPDTLFVIPGVNFPFNLLPLLMGGASVWQAHLTPTSPGVDPMQQKIMRYMPLIMVAIFYNLPAGLTLYYTVQSLLSVLQTKLTRTQLAPAAAAPALTPSLKRKK